MNQRATAAVAEGCREAGAKSSEICCGICKAQSNRQGQHHGVLEAETTQEARPRQARVFLGDAGSLLRNPYTGYRSECRAISTVVCYFVLNAEDVDSS